MDLKLALDLGCGGGGFGFGCGFGFGFGVGRGLEFGFGVGFGFGGWKNEIANCETIYILDYPHNTLLALWANSGIIAVIIGLFFIYSILRFGYKLTRIKDIELNRLGYGVILSFLFCFIQGMGENYGLIGEEHMSIILFTFLGYVYAQKKQQNV